MARTFVTADEIDRLLLFAEYPKEREVLELCKKHGSYPEVAKVMGVGRTAPHATISRLRRRAAKKGVAPGHFEAGTAPGYSMGKVTVQRGPEGEVRQTWERQNPDEAARTEALLEAVRGLSDDIPRAKPQPRPAIAYKDLLSAYVIGDPHAGLYTWKDEVGENFDLAEFERRMTGAVDRLVAATPPSKGAMLINLGDALHTPDGKNKTPGHGHNLDVDGRFGKVVQVFIRSMHYAIDRLLEKHREVLVWNVRGNHEDDAAPVLAMCQQARYENEPRVTVPIIHGLFSYHEHGRCLIGAHHGHGPKHTDLPVIMANDEAEAWGRTEHRYWLVGHVHHKTMKESPGCVVETFNTLAAEDAWHKGKGYRAKKSMTAIVYHTEFGEMERHVCDLSQLKAHT